MALCISRRVMKKLIYVCVIVFIFYLSAFFTMAAEEQIFRDELNSDYSLPSVSYEKYQKELAKLFKPRPIYDFVIGEYILFPLGVIVLVIAVIFFIRQIRMNLIREAKEDEVAKITLDHVETEKVALAHAETAVASNDFRSAIRYLYLSAVLHLQEQGILPYDKSLTNREYLQQSQVNNILQTKLGSAVMVFDEVWYGHKPCGSDTVTNYRKLLQQIYNS